MTKHIKSHQKRQLLKSLERIYKSKNNKLEKQKIVTINGYLRQIGLSYNKNKYICNNNNILINKEILYKLNLNENKILNKIYI